jgi:ATP-dependent helicase/nuclease subunit B
MLLEGNMSLRFIVGSAGSGKSTCLYEYVIEESMSHPEENYLVIVPEQFTLATQQRLVDMHPRHAIMNIDVVSFDRMAYRVFDELGTSTLQVLEETGKHLLLRKVAQEQEAHLQVLGKNIRRPGYITQMKSLISELSQYDISPEDLQDIISDPAMDEAFRRKAGDILVMYQGFCDKIAGHYITAEGILQTLMEVMGDSKILKQATLVFDDFTGFTPMQNQLLQQLMPITKQMIFTVTCDPDASLFHDIREQELFAMSKRMVQRLMKLAQEVRVPVEDPLYLHHRGRFLPEGQLEHLERNLFRPAAGSYDGTRRDEIARVSLADPRQELWYVAGEIEQQVRKQGMHYRDFAVVCASMETYAHLVPQVFSSYHIPYFLDVKSEIVYHPFVESISSLFSMVEENFSYESVMHHLRCGMSHLSIDEIDHLENYILAAGIRGQKKYREIFTIHPQGYTPEEMVELNRIREKFFTPIAAFLQPFSGKRGKVLEISKALYALLRDYRMEEQLAQRAEDYETAKDEVRARENEQIYGLVMDLLDKLAAILGDEELTLAEYGELLAAGFESIRVGVIPPGNDQVLIGDMERSRLQQIRVLYLVGAVDGAIPKSQGHGGILSQIDRENLRAANYEVAPTDRERSFMQRFYLYLMMTKPTEKLVVTYARVDTDGKAVRKSYLLHTLSKMFPDTQERFVEDLPLSSRLLTRECAREYYVECLRKYADTGEVSPALPMLLAWEQQQEQDQNAGYVEAAFYSHKAEKLSRAAVDAVFGREMKESVSRLEQYASCAYSYFLKYGLALRPRQEYGFEAVDMGNLYHMALEYYSQSLQQREDTDWYTITDEQSRDLLQQAIRHTCQNMAKTQLMESARDRYILESMEKTLQQTVWALQQQIRKGSFIPTAFEVDFKEVEQEKALSYQLDEMHRMQLRGKIDRVDLWEQEGTVYVKIVDYKSGHKDLDMDRLYHGLQVQLVLYMDAVTRGIRDKEPDKAVLPGALFYYHIDRPIVDGAGDSVDQQQKKILRELRMRGIVNADPQVIEAMDHGLEGTSDVIPVGLKKDGTPSALSHILNAEDIQTMEEYGAMLMETTGRKMIRGEFDCVPYRLDQENGCTYCDFHGICGFDPEMEGYGWNRLSSGGSRSEIIEKMRQELAIYHHRQEAEGEA